MAFSKIIAESMDLTDAYNFTGTLQQNGAGIGGDNKPAFHAYANTNQTGLSDNTWVKLQMNVEDLDTDSAYDHSSNYRFTPQTAGKYLIYLHAVIFSESANQGYVFNGSIYKNGTALFTDLAISTNIETTIPFFSYYGASNTFNVNFGNGYFGATAVSSAQNPADGNGIFEHSVPSGYRALCTKSINAEEYS